MILARLQHLLEVVCMCEGWITEALAGGGIKRSFSVVLQNLKFHEGKICMSQIKPEHLQEEEFKSQEKNLVHREFHICTETNNSECLALISLKLSFNLIHF